MSHIEKSVIHRLGFYSSLAAFVAAAGYCIVQLLQIAGLIQFPQDAILIYGFSLAISFPYIISTIAIFHILPDGKRIWAHLAIAFAVMYAVYVNLNYIVQLATVIPASANGPLSAMQLLDQTPHSLFWDVDALGYINMGISTLFLWFAVDQQYRWLRIFLLANALMVPVISFVYFYPQFTTGLLMMAAPWMITTPGSLLLLCHYFWAVKA